MAEKENCIWHKDRPAVGCCAFCGAPVCDECHEGAYCKLCIHEPPKRKSKALLFAVLLGWLGVHRYYMGFYVTGVIYTLTLGICGIGWAIDVIRILFWSTERKPSYSILGAVSGAIGDTIMENASSDAREFLNGRFWRDKYGRPLLPLGKKTVSD
jgi:TM2 domain-containing membrane protein YozV